MQRWNCLQEKGRGPGLGKSNSHLLLLSEPPFLASIAVVLTRALVSVVPGNRALFAICANPAVVVSVSLPASNRKPWKPALYLQRDVSSTGNISTEELKLGDTCPSRGACPAGLLSCTLPCLPALSVGPVDRLRRLRTCCQQLPVQRPESFSTAAQLDTDSLFVLETDVAVQETLILAHKPIAAAGRIVN